MNYEFLAASLKVGKYMFQCKLSPTQVSFFALNRWDMGYTQTQSCATIKALFVLYDNDDCFDK